MRSIVGLLPLAAVGDLRGGHPREAAEVSRSVPGCSCGRHPELVAERPSPESSRASRSSDAVHRRREKLRRILARMLDEAEFFGPHGIRALSRFHLDHPYVFHHAGQDHRVAYVPGDSDTGMFGGNSNWRGPVWMPINFLLYTALLRLYAYYGEDFKVECPTGSGQMMTLLESRQRARRAALPNLPARPRSGRRPVYGATHKFKDDPHWRDLVLFFEYFHGDTGAGIGAESSDGLDRLHRPDHRGQCRAHQGAAARARRRGGGHEGAARRQHTCDACVISARLTAGKREEHEKLLHAHESPGTGCCRPCRRSGCSRARLRW